MTLNGVRRILELLLLGSGPITNNKCIDSENQGKFIYSFWCYPVFTTKSKCIEWVNQ